MIESDILELAQFLLENAPIVIAVKNAIAAGVTKDQIAHAIRSVQVAASDEIMRDKLGLPS